MRQFTIAVAVVLYVSCGAGQEYKPVETSPLFYRYQWAVAVDEYVPVYTEPAGDSAPITLLRLGDVLQIENIRVSSDQYAGTTGQWYLVAVPDISAGWIFETSFTGFYKRDQALRYSRQLLE